MKIFNGLMFEIKIFLKDWIFYLKLVLIIALLFFLCATDFIQLNNNNTPIYYFFLPSYGLKIAQGLICLISGVYINDKFNVDIEKGNINYHIIRTSDLIYKTRLLIISFVKLFLIGFMSFFMFIGVLHIKFNFSINVLDTQLINSLFVGRFLLSGENLLFYIIYASMVGLLCANINIICIGISFLLQNKKVITFLPYVIYILFNSIPSNKYFAFLNPSNIYSGLPIIRQLSKKFCSSEISLFTECLFPVFSLFLSCICFYLLSSFSNKINSFEN